MTDSLRGGSFVRLLSPHGASSSAGTEDAQLGMGLPLLYVNLARHVIPRKLVGGETEIGSSIEVVVAWKIIYRISGK